MADRTKLFLAGCAAIAALGAVFLIRSTGVSEKNLLGQAAIDDTASITVHITTTTPASVNPRIFGAHVAGLFDRTIYDQKKSNVYDSATGTYTPDQYALGLIDQLKLRAFRYPTGTDGRFFHPTNVDGTPAKGYGIRAEEVTEDAEITHYNPFPFSSLEGYLNYQETLPFGFTIAMGAFIKQNPDTNAPVIGAINVVHGTPEEAVETVRQLKAQGITLLGVEMGNELYAKKLDAGGDAQTYLDMVRPFAQAIKDAYPNLSIGLSAAPPSAKADGTPTDDFYNWNNRVAQALKTETYNSKPLYSAYIPHVYQGIVCDPDVFTTSAALLDCARTKMDIIARESDINPITQKVDILGNATALRSYTLVDELSLQQDVFGNAPMWITEWGIPVSGDDPGKNITGTGFQNTLLMGNYVLSALQLFNTYNNTHGGVIKAAFYHNLATPNFVTFGVISEPQVGGKEQFTDNTASPEKRRTPWYAFKVASPIFNANGMRVISASVSGAPAYAEVTSYRDAGGSYYLYVSNLSGREVSLHGLTVDDTPVDLSKTNGYAELVSGNDLAASSGYTYFDATGIADPISYATSTQKLSEVTIPKYAFGYIKFTPVFVSEPSPSEPDDTTPSDSNPDDTSDDSSSHTSVIGTAYPVNTPIAGTVINTDQSLDTPVAGTVTITAVQTQAAPIKPAAPTTSTTTPAKPSSTPTKPTAPASIPQPSTNTTITSIDYILDTATVHTATTFPDTFALDTNTLSNDWHTLSTVYHHADGSTTESIKFFKVENNKTIIEKLTDGTIRIWNSIRALVQGWF